MSPIMYDDIIQMSSKTTVAVSSKFTEDRFWLNGVESEVVESERLRNCLNAGMDWRKRRLTNKCWLY